MYSLYLVKKYPPLVFLFICKSSLVSYLKYDIITVDVIYFYLFCLFIIYWDLQRLFTPGIIKLYCYYFMIELIMCGLIVGYYGTQDVNIVAYTIISLIFNFSALVSTYVQSFISQGERERNIELTRIEFQHVDISTFIEKRCKDYDCTICLEPGSEGFKIVNCNCDILYHEICILTWLLDNMTCPICRINVCENV